MSRFPSQRYAANRSHSVRYPSARRRRPAKAYIDHRRFIQPARPRTITEHQIKHTFADFALAPLLQTNIAAKGIQTPTPIQDQAIPVALAGRDVVGLADTGTGKTIAFMVPILNRLIAEPGSRALVMAPTRELAQQIEAECRLIARGSGLHGAVLIGGASMSLQLRDLRTKPELVIGTPGRIKDHLERGSLDLSGFALVALDEVDRMLDMGFIEDTQLILSKLAPKRQSFFFSATLGPAVQRLIDTFSANYETISVKHGDASENVEQNIVFAEQGRKVDQLHDLLMQPVVAKALVFDDTRHGVERLHQELQARGFGVDAIHGGKTQQQRQKALDRFKRNDVTILIATDVAARGIDIADITHVINYSTPQSYEDYVHRVGRAGRAGRMGYALTFVDRSY